MISLPLASAYNAGAQTVATSAGGLYLFLVLTRNVTGTLSGNVRVSWTENGSGQFYDTGSVANGMTRDTSGPYSIAPDSGTNITVTVSGTGTCTGGTIDLYLGRIKEES